MKIILYLLLTTSIIAQSISVETVRKLDLDGKYFHPKFIDSELLLLSKENYRGLFLFNIQTNELITVTGEFGAGYFPQVLNKTVYFRTHVLENGRKYFSLKKYNLFSQKTEVIEGKSRKLLPPIKVDDEIIYALENRVYSLNKKLPSLFVTNENSEIVLHQNGSTKILKPFGEGIYVWVELSPDKKYIVFTYGTEGSFIIDLNGNIIHSIGKDAHFAHWSPDGRYLIFMSDVDDGYKYIDSDIWIFDTVSENRIQLTNTENIIEMYPQWSNDGKEAVFHDLEGNIYIAKLKMEGDE